MKFNIQTLTLFLVIMLGWSGVNAQSVTVSDVSAAPDSTTPSISIDYEAGGDVVGFQFDILYDSASLGNPALSCNADLSGACDLTCTNPEPGRIQVICFDSSSAVQPTGNIGTFSLDLGSVQVGEVFPLDIDISRIGTGFSDSDGTAVPPAALDNGTVTAATASVPAGESFYSSTPSVNSNVDLGSAGVNSSAGPVNVTVSNLQDDGMNSFEITDASGTNGGATIAGTVPSGSATVLADGGTNMVDISFECTPTARGQQSGTLAIANDSDNEGPSAGYDYTCAGESPNVQVPAGPVGLSGTLAGPDPSDTITVTNPQDGFTSTANNLTATGGAGDTEITVSGGPTNLAPGDSFNFSVSCNSSAEGNFSRTIDFAWDDPVGTGTDSITVNCAVSDTAPVYESDPMPGTTIALSAPFDTQSGPDGLDVRNANPNTAADDLIINSATPSDAAVFSVTVNQSTFPANGTFDGSDDIEVTCMPEGVGTVNGTLTVQTNDPNEPAGGFTYPLSCEGTGDVVTSSTPAGGTLTLGTVPPGTSTGEGLISFTNNGIAGTGDVTVDCTVTDNSPSGDVFTVTPDPISFRLAEGNSEDAGFQCTPPDISSFTASVSCTYGGAIMGGANFTVSCAGRPLVIPTMSRWGLVLMSLLLLLVGGFATRRMMA